MANPIPKTQKALKCFGPNNVKVVNDAPVPTCPDDYILVRVETIALNPTDWKHTMDYIAKPDYHHTIGCDYAGTVVSVGSAVTKKFSIGDRVTGFAHGSKHEDPQSGCFAEYAKAKGDIAVSCYTQDCQNEGDYQPRPVICGLDCPKVLVQRLRVWLGEAAKPEI